MDILAHLVTKRPIVAVVTLLFPVQSIYLVLMALLPTRATLELWDVHSLISAVCLSIFYLVLSARTQRHILLVLCVSIWATRLGAFLGGRAADGFDDVRLTKFRSSRRGHLMWMAAQILWIAIALLPVWVGVNGVDARAITAMDMVGITVFLLGFSMECAADRQKAGFLARRNRDDGKYVCDVGLFKYSRFPQYFGEILIWIGLALLAWSGTKIEYRLLLPLSPLFMYKLLSGVCIPIADSKVKKRANDEEFRKYMETSVLLPWPKRR